MLGRGQREDGAITGKGTDRSIRRRGRVVLDALGSSELARAVFSVGTPAQGGEPGKTVVLLFSE